LTTTWRHTGDLSWTRRRYPAGNLTGTGGGAADLVSGVGNPLIDAFDLLLHVLQLASADVLEVLDSPDVAHYLVLHGLGMQGLGANPAERGRQVIEIAVEHPR
jgi:hypothetical protein